MNVKTARWPSVILPSRVILPSQHYKHPMHLAVPCTFTGGPEGCLIKHPVHRECTGSNPAYLNKINWDQHTLSARLLKLRVLPSIEMLLI